MISKEEIIALADQTGLAPLIIEKDYVLGWLLAGIWGFGTKWTKKDDLNITYCKKLVFYGNRIKLHFL